MNKEKLKESGLLMLEYVRAYLLGIVAAIVITPAQLSLAGVQLWYLYPILSIPAFFLFSTQLSANLSWPNIIVACIYLVSIGCVLFGIAAHFGSLRRYQHLSPKLIGSTIGFMGTFAVYLISMGSI